MRVKVAVNLCLELETGFREISILSADFDRALQCCCRMLCYECDIAESTDRVGAGVPTIFLVCSLILERKDPLLLPSGIWCRMSGGGRSDSYLRSTPAVSLDAVGTTHERWALPRFLECCSRSHVVPRRIFVSQAYKVTYPTITTQVTAPFRKRRLLKHLAPYPKGLGVTHERVFRNPSYNQSVKT